MNKKLLSLVALALASTALVACSSASPAKVTGTWGQEDVQGEPSLVLEENGSLHGSDGCNRIVGDYKAEGQDITFGVLATTMMYCEGVDTWLGLAKTAKVSGDSLVIFDESNKEIGTLARA